VTDYTKQLARGLAIYDWPESIDFGQNSDFLLQLVDDLEIKPTKVWFGLENSKGCTRTVFKKTTLAKVLSEFPAYQNLELCTPIGGDYTNVEHSLSYSRDAGELSDRDYSVKKYAETWSVDDALSHLKLLTKHFTPGYGFSIVMPSVEIGWFQGGVGTMSMTKEERQRADALRCTVGQRGPFHSEFGKLHDVYELNVLSPTHVKRDTFGQTLASWIGAGKRGELLEIKRDVFVWLVPDNIRTSIRASFLKADLLTSPV
jgi:hypothetical protein